MLDNTGDWCFEGGCTFLTETSITTKEELETGELEAMYREPCAGMYD